MLQGNRLAGRLVKFRPHGGICFGNILSNNQLYQVAFKKDEVINYLAVKSLPVGSLIELTDSDERVTSTGDVAIFAIGEVKIHFIPSIPMPDRVKTNLLDEEVRQRQRYLDLISNPDSFLRFAERSQIISSLRMYLTNEGYAEVETPVLHSNAGGAIARPFNTYHNAYSQDYSLRIAPELFLKKLLVGGFEKVFEIGKNFRNEGVDQRHNPEFTMLEFYTAYMDNEDSLLFTMRMIQDICKSFCEIDDPLVNDIWNIKDHDKLTGLGWEIAKNFPIEESPLAKALETDPNIADRFEIYYNGLELANGYQEETDADLLEGKMAAYCRDESEVDHSFVEALRYGMPPCSGVGIGIDRLVMIITNARSIRDVILFPTLKREN